MILECTSLKRNYQVGQVEVNALRGVDFKISENSLTMITGASGSGKSTLLHCIAGVDKPDSGRVLINGTDIHALNPHDSAIFRRRNIGLIYQFFNLLPTLTARQNILLPLSLDNRSAEAGYFDELTETLGIANRIDHYPSQMSGGEQQRCAIARALITKPALCLADEPTGNLDRKNTDEIMNLLKQTNQKFGHTIVMVTHDRRLTALADRVVEMEDGLIVADIAGGISAANKNGDSI